MIRALYIFIFALTVLLAAAQPTATWLERQHDFGVFLEKNGKVFNLRVFGTDKTAIAETVISDVETLKALKYGYCKTSGEFVTADGLHPALYVNLSAIV